MARPGTDRVPRPEEPERDTRSRHFPRDTDRSAGALDNNPVDGSSIPRWCSSSRKRCPGLQAQAALGLGKDAQAKLLDAAFPLDGEAVGRCHLVDENGDIGPRHREPLYVGVVQGPVELTDEPGQRSNLSPEIVNVGL